MGKSWAQRADGRSCRHRQRVFGGCVAAALRAGAGSAPVLRARGFCAPAWRWLALRRARNRGPGNRRPRPVALRRECGAEPVRTHGVDRTGAGIVRPRRASQAPLRLNFIPGRGCRCSAAAHKKIEFECGPENWQDVPRRALAAILVCCAIGSPRGRRRGSALAPSSGRSCLRAMSRPTGPCQISSVASARWAIARVRPSLGYPGFAP
jgi:hypothetical protein